MMNQENTNNTQAQATITLTEAVVELTQLLKEAISLAKEEEAASTTTTETTATTKNTTEATTATTEANSTTPIIVIDDDDTVIGVGFKGSMNEQDPMDHIPTYEENAAAETAAEETLDNIICDISTLYDVADYTLGNEGYNVSVDNSPYAPENKVASIDNYKVYISKEINKGDTVIGEFRLIVNEKNSGVKILDHSLKIINDHVKVFSSENTVRIEKLKESKKLMRFLEITDEISALVMSKYIK